MDLQDGWAILDLILWERFARSVWPSPIDSPDTKSSASTSMWASHCSTPGPLYPGRYRQICRDHDPRLTFRIFGTRYRTMPLGTPNLKYLQDEIPGTKSLDPTHVRLASAGICSFPESLCTKGSDSSCSRETFCAALVRG
jgi:hypothetical protein